ncbi:MAG: phenylalanine--tRNA ligase subunit beta, partial [Candidatus Margulisiibacteriota bacterium]
MKLPLGWLNDFIENTGSTDQIVSSLLEHSCEVEEVHDSAKRITHVVVGKIIAIDKHPNADKLVVCQLDIGSVTRQIVTGATNVNVGDYVPVALDGALLPNGLSIKASSLRGINSEGMLCSQKELGLAETAEGILILPSTAPLGQNIVEYLNLETVLTVAVLPNRGDLLSIRGIAREIAAITDQPLKEVPIYSQKASSAKTRPLSIQIDAPALCKRYMGIAIQGVRLADSPEWMQRRLNAAGLSCINNIVDITNYVMLELGQPLHAFSYANITKARIIVRQAHDQESITLLNGESVTLTSSHLVIADSEKPLALAGIMGGLHSAISADTTDIVLESAFFNAVSIRKTAFELA